MTKKIQSIRGMHDILPQQTPSCQDFDNAAKTLLKQYGYHVLRLPVVDMSELFRCARGVLAYL